MTLGEVVRFTRQEFLKRFNFGNKSVNEIDELLTRYGFAYLSEEERVKSFRSRVTAGLAKRDDALNKDLFSLDVSPLTYRSLADEGVVQLIRVVRHTRSAFIARYCPSDRVIEEIDMLLSDLGFEFEEEERSPPEIELNDFADQNIEEF